MICECSGNAIRLRIACKNKKLSSLRAHTLGRDDSFYFDFEFWPCDEAIHYIHKG